MEEMSFMLGLEKWGTFSAEVEESHCREKTEQRGPKEWNLRGFLGMEKC